ncbi:AraC family transcriptional regulator [Paenibacillus psychroresistens]|uniref:AraC family transcriptional regulator n=1 Tax=Paenibacillus psychroresistens TaxID=1778678 RepID=A0A6B8RWT5_9BACL|nr:AraC family transcriptional regulator [Paenibacillus psychroresistens]
MSELVGYIDKHYFSRIFKNSEGITPTEYSALPK